MLAPFQRTRFVRDDRQKWRKIAVVRLDGFSLSRSPDNLVTVRSQGIENIQFSLSNGVVRQTIAIAPRSFGKFEKSAITIGRVAIRDTIAIKPVKILIIHGDVKRFPLFLIGPGNFPVRAK